MRSKEAHVLESIANPALPTLQIVEYRGETTESAPATRSVTSAHPERYTLRTISHPAPPAPSAQLAPAAPTLRAAANGYGFEENTDASAQRHAQTPQVAAALRNAPGLAKLHAVTSGSADSANRLCLWYEPLDAGTLDKLLRARTLTPAELMTLARTLHRALGSLKKVGEGRAELSAEYIALSAAGVPKLLLPDAVYRETAPQDGEQLTAARGNYARSAAALLWQAACGHAPEPSTARVPLSLRMDSQRMGAADTATEGAPNSEWIERLGRALEYLLDAPAQEAALAGLSSVVALAEEVPPRPLNVYLSCSERARALIPVAVEPAPVQKLSKTQKAQRYLAERLPHVKKPGVKKSGRAATAGSKPLTPTGSPAVSFTKSPAETAPSALKNAEATGTSRLTALRGALSRPSVRLGVAALALGAIALPLGFTLYGQNAPATAQPVSAQSVNTAGEQEPGGTETQDQSTQDTAAQDKSAQGDQILRALIDQRNQERRARGGAELTVDTAEELSRDSENIRVMAVVSVPGYRADKTEREARKLSEENGVTRQKVIFDLHRGEKGWEIARAEPVPA
ncbi:MULTISPECIES: peptidase [unclassified Rothia (in: high G+C Gram-positive bacteria)]|uniref:peptidase n=1 Tax=unclassified Rothia (in: high G+C Gram-positive bacteria) TaxID=2689056 RepID=UPI0008A1F87B|nr:MULTISPECIES: peptidase [unclassified Rothia (in: high G+C Gram-positive bacteria)]OFO20604.1 peptidase [Rothia sp. HMSC061C12]OFP59749.1 peptidase [Rothia sp. HMSC076D04]